MTGGLEVGAIVGGRYRLKRRLGEGAMGFVWEATHVHTHARFALKFLKGAKEEDRRRFQRELRAAAAIDHPNVIKVHDFVEQENGLVVMVMDLLEGETIGDVLRREQKIELPTLSAITLAVVSALEASHAAGIVHRDLKPDNIFLAKGKDNSVMVKVLDFGVAKLTAEDGLAARTQALTATGSIVGTPYYMSPEQVVSEKDLDARADIWSLGVVLYECLAGVRPTEGDNVGRVLRRILVADFEPMAKHRPDLPKPVTSLIDRMLEVERSERTKELTEIRGVLDAYAAKTIAPFGRSVPKGIAGPAQDVDAHAETVSDGAQNVDAKVATGRGDTTGAVSMAARRGSRRTPIVVAAVVGVGAVVGIGLKISGPNPSTPPRVDLVFSAPGSASTLAPASASASTSPAASTWPPPSTSPSASLSASASPSASAPPSASPSLVRPRPASTARTPSFPPAVGTASATPSAVMPVTESAPASKPSSNVARNPKD